MKEPVHGSQLLVDLTMGLQRHVRLSDDEYFVIAPWILHCHTWPAWTRTPYLNLSSATQECGKTLLLELIELLVPNPILVMGCSAAVLPRAIHQEHPVLLIDETDMLAKGDKELWATILQTINSGYKKSGTRLVSEVAKGGWSYRRLSTFCPKALSGISELPAATASRCIPINMQRMLPDDRVEEIDEYVTEPLANELFKRCEAWGKAHLKQLRDARPDAPPELGHRQREVSRPLLAIADAVGDGWGERVRAALVRLFTPRAGEPDSNIRIQLLHDMEGVFGDRRRISSKDAAERLGADADAPWAAWGKSQKAITQAKLAELLWNFKVAPKRQRNDDGSNLRGYDREQFDDLWQRYPKPPSTDPSTPIKPSLDRNSGTTRINIDENEFSARNSEPVVPPLKSASAPRELRAVPPVPPKRGGNGSAELEAVCRTHGKDTTFWQHPDGSLVCQRCHPEGKHLSKVDPRQMEIPKETITASALITKSQLQQQQGKKDAADEPKRRA